MPWTAPGEPERLERLAYASAVNSHLLREVSTSALGLDAEVLRAVARRSPWARGVRRAILDELHARAQYST